MFRCPNCDETSIGWFRKLTSGTWGPCRCRACGMLSRESRVPRTIVSTGELGSLWLIFFTSYISNPTTWAIAATAWPPAYVVTEWICLFHIPLVAASDQWERAKDILSWVFAGGLIAIIIVAAIAFIK